VPWLEKNNLASNFISSGCLLEVSTSVAHHFNVRHSPWLGHQKKVTAFKGQLKLWTQNIKTASFSTLYLLEDNHSNFAGVHIMLNLNITSEFNHYISVNIQIQLDAKPV
jgi:hypothetical protein